MVQGTPVLEANFKRLTAFLTNPTLPERGWSDLEIEWALSALAQLDSNNRSCVGVGEREGRILSGMVSRRAMGFAHGIGRSGNLLEIQPKAPGSACLQKTTHQLVKQALKLCGLHKDTVRELIVLPVATGMAIMLALLALRKLNPARHKVIWLRIDQKSALKAIDAAGLEVIVVEGHVVGEEVRTDLAALEATIQAAGSREILCVLSCTSCFAPRAPDDIKEIGRLCSKYEIGHLVNNAYGFQSSHAVGLINETILSAGRIDAIVGSTDKNFGVPVGGAIVCGPNAEFILAIGKAYPGRASSAPLIDIFITLLSLGRQGLQELLQRRKVLLPFQCACVSFLKETFTYFRQRLSDFLPHHGLRLINTPHNDISMAILVGEETDDLGAKLFLRNVSGARLVKMNGKSVDIAGVVLSNFGAHNSAYPHSYLNVASSIGQATEDVDGFLQVLAKLLPPPKDC